MAGVSASDVIRIGGLAWEVYRLGWAEELNASSQYQEFGNDIRCLAENLGNISKVISNAQATWAQESLRVTRTRGLTSQKDWDLSSLNEIIGDYHRTLIDCRILLEENYEYRKNRNFAYNIEWNVVIQPKVDHLRKRLDAHNAKISILLKPLELNLLSEIHRDLADRIDAVHRSILRLHGLLIPDVEQAMYEQGQVEAIPLAAPPEIERKFQKAAESIFPEVQSLGRFPLQAGADAFVTHFEQSTKRFTAGNFINERKPQPQEYLALLKCAWIIRCLQDSDALRNTPQDSQWPGYVNQLHQDLLMECQRFTTPSTQRLIAPNLDTLRRDDEYEIWPSEDMTDYISPHTEACLEEVLKIPMPSPSSSIERNMSIVRLDSSKYRIIESVEDKDSTSSRRKEFKMDIDLKTFGLTPIYATPSSRQKSLEVLISSASTKTNPTFSEMKYLLRLQHLLTGYKVYERYDQPMVTASFFISGQADVVEHARLQLWLPHPFNNSSSSTSTSPSISRAPSAMGQIQASLNASMESMTMGNTRGDISPSGQRGQNSCSPFSRSQDSFNRFNNRGDLSPISPVGRSSGLTSSTPRGLMTPMASQENVLPSRLSIRSSTSKNNRRAPSVMTNSSTFSRSTVTSTTTISTGTGRAHLHSKPAKPLLVMFLKSQDRSGKLAIAAVELDDLTVVERQRCLCLTALSKCLISCVERREGCLKIQRWEADHGLSSWNLACLSSNQRKELPANVWNDVKRVMLKFDSYEDRYKFSGSPCSCRPKMQHDLSRCILDGHQGTFGVVKQIGSQRLKNYHQEQAKAASRNMVLAPLAEDEL